MFHSTTILAVRHRDRAVLAGDGQVTFGDTVVKQSARKIRRLYNDRILAGFAGSAADSFALFSRFESKLEQYRGNLERSAVELAKDWRTDRIAAPPRSDADRRSTSTRRSCCRAPAISSSPTMGSWRSDRADRTRWPRRRRWRDTPTLDARAIAEKAMDDRRRHLHLHERATSRSKSCSGDGHLPAGDDADLATESLTPRQIVAELDKYVVGQARRSAPSRSRCATGCAARSCRPSWPKRSRRRTS